MILFSLAGYEHALAPLPRTVQRGTFEICRFENGELFVRLSTPVRQEHCVILGSVAPPDERLLSLALLAHTLKKEGCQKLTAFLPYMAYSRQDKDKPGESLAVAWLGSVLKASGVDDVFTVDVHSERDKQLFQLPLMSIFPADLFASAIKQNLMTNATIVAPDKGAIPRSEAVNRSLGRPDCAIPYFEKKRDRTGIKHTEMFGSVGPRAIIIDDILDTGATLISACNRLLQVGTREIFIMVTHGLFTGTSWKELWSLGVQQIFCTDTVPPTKEMLNEARIRTLHVGQLLKEQLGDPGGC